MGNLLPLSDNLYALRSKVTPMALCSLSLCLISLTALAATARADTRPVARAPASEARHVPAAVQQALADGKKASPGTGPLRPINITSERFEIMPNAERAIWTGSVVAERDDMRISCDKLTAEFGERRKIRSVLCEGNVHMVQRQSLQGPKTKSVSREAWGERAYFDNQRSLVTVTGNPEAREGENRIQGEKVLFYVEEDRVVVEKPRMVLETEAAAGGKL